MNYYELQISLVPNTETNRDILAALLAETGFESFIESETGLTAYVPEKNYSKERIDELFALSPLNDTEIKRRLHYIETQDWNEEWEKNFFQPIIIDRQCVIHSSFHKNIPDLPYDIVIDPKMAFGTGHHETTSLMISFLLQAEVEGKSFLDMGCGTAVLAILAKMRGAARTLAIDNDEWAWRNALDNLEINRVQNIEVLLGDANRLHSEQFDFIFANINRNILLADIPIYAACMKQHAGLYISGFYLEDLDSISKECRKNGLQFLDHKTKNNWTAARFERS